MGQEESTEGTRPTWTSLQFEPDVLHGFERRTLALASEGDGELAATLVRHRGVDPSRPAVLYIHGFVDYFFQAHLAQAIADAGLAFYAIDLRRYGRSLRPDNRANQAGLIDDYFVELDAAVEQILAVHPRLAGVVAHSTGALLAVLYAARGAYRDRLERLVLNSPFFRFRFSTSERAQFEAVKRIGVRLPRLRLPVGLPVAYGKTLHEDHEGEWSYDLAWKPLAGFPFYAGWFTMIDRAQSELPGLELQLPILTLRSSQSRVPSKKVAPEDFRSDTVLDVADMQEIGSGLGPHARVQVVADGLHDLVLSAPPVRAEALRIIQKELRPSDAEPR